MTIKHLFPPVWPTLNLDFANSKALDPRITFSRASTGTYVDADGIIQTAVDNEPRFDHSGAGESLGLLIEESRTNLFENSVYSVFSDWQNNDAGTLVANAAISPDGTSTAAEYTQAAQYDRAVNLNFSQDSPLVFSCFVKPVNGDGWTIGAAATNTYGNGVYTFSTQQWSGSGLSNLEDYGVDELPNGWYRLWVAFGATATGGNTLLVRCIDADVSGIQGYLWGVQLEAGAFPTSYIPTAGSTETRASDIVTITGTNFSSWYNQSEGTMQMTFNVMNNGLNAERFLSAASSTASTTTGYIYRVSTLYPATDTGSNNWTSTNSWLNTGIIPGNNNFVFGYSPGSNATVRDGVIQETNTETVLVEQSSTALYMLSQISGHISRLAYYNTRLSDEQLQALTA